MEWVFSCQALGMWHAMQPLAALMGQGICFFRDDDFVAWRPEVAAVAGTRLLACVEDA
jgi:hypothetical protein